MKRVKNLPVSGGSLNVAILSDAASQHFVKALKAAAAMNNIKLHVWEAEYNTIDSTVYDQTSELYTRQFDFIFLLFSSQKLYQKFSVNAEKQNFTFEIIAGIENLLEALAEQTKAKLVIGNFIELDDSLFGNYANKTKLSFLYQLRNLNLKLAELSIKKKNLFVLDVQAAFCWVGRSNAINPQLYIHADLVYDLDFVAMIAQRAMQLILSVKGNIKKCVVLDLDNTLWGGIIGDDGIENINLGTLGIGKAFSNLQVWLKNLKERGIILAVCSKNSEDIAKDVFINHPEMVLRLTDIAVFVANWETKVDNLLHIQSVLNIGFDSFVFLDDNPFEREIVKKHIPDITVPDLPEDPAQYLEYLQSLNLFETASLSEEDANRTQQYQEEAVRTTFQKRFKSEDDFLSSLEMQAIVEPVNQFTCPRVAQLTQRSNQFNLRTVRYTEEDIAGFINHPEKLVITVTLKDVFGDYGLISCVILEKLDNKIFIDTWVMSCRVLKRGVEKLVLNEIVNFAKEKGVTTITGAYIPTQKNGLVKDHYKSLGFDFDPKDDLWLLDVTSYSTKPTFISKTNEYVIHQ